MTSGHGVWDGLEAVARANKVKGELVLPPALAEVLVRELVHPSKSPPLEDLSDREREVLELMAEGRSNQAMSEQPFLNPQDGRGPRSLDLHEARFRARGRRSPPGASPLTFDRSELFCDAPARRLIPT